MKKFVSSFVALCMVFAMCSATASAATVEVTDAEEPIIIGEFDGLLTDCLDPNTPAPQIQAIANVRINSYATYDSRDGVQVTVKLYVPWYEFPQPQFTGMSGNVNVLLNGRSSNTSFAEIALGDSTISSDVNTGRTAASGTTGTVTVSGTATALNALAGGGAFFIDYGITIP